MEKIKKHSNNKLIARWQPITYVNGFFVVAATWKIKNGIKILKEISISEDASIWITHKVEDALLWYGVKYESGEFVNAQ